MGTPSSNVGPGLGAFVAFFVLALVLWLLLRNMNARMRRMAYREQERLRRLEAQAGGPEAAGPEAVAPEPGAPEGGGPGSAGDAAEPPGTGPAGPGPAGPR